MSLSRTIAAALTALIVTHAHAHAFLDHAEPRVGSTVVAPPAELKLWFTEDIEPAFSTVQVLDANGNRVDKADARVDATHREFLRVSLRGLGPGEYTVRWRAVSTDTHVTEGDFAFHVAQ